MHQVFLNFYTKAFSKRSTPTPIYICFTHISKELQFFEKFRVSKIWKCFKANSAINQSDHA